MSYQNETIGMMDEGYFVSRGDIMKWLNDLLQLNLTKIEQLGSGAVYCQVVDVIHPGKVALAKVNWKAKSQYEFINNFRILQDSFNKIGLKRYIEVEKLSKARYQDNLQFAQWLKKYYDLNCGDRGNNYLAEERRGGNNPDFGFAQKNVVPKTYNSGGAIIPKKQSPPKKKQTTTETAPKKVASTATGPRVHAQNETKPPKKMEKKQGVTSGSPVRVKRQEKTKQKPEHEDKQLNSNQKQEFQRQKYEMVEREKILLKRVKEMEDKLLMVTQILRSEEPSQLKVQMISEVVDHQTKTQQQEEQQSI